MNKLQLIEIIQNRLGGGSVTDDIKEKYRSGVVKFHIGIVFDDIILRVFQNNDNPGLSDLDAYCKVFPVTALQTADSTGEKYVEIPTTRKRLLQIPNNKAIRQIYTIEQVTNPVTASRKCLYREWGMDSVYSQLEVNTYLGTTPKYKVMGTRIYFNSQIGAATGVTIWMICSFDEFTDTEDLPAALENNGTLIEEVIARLQNMPPEDKIIDDNPVQV